MAATLGAMQVPVLILLIALLWCSLFSANLLSVKINTKESLTVDGLKTEFWKLLWVDSAAVQLVVAAVLSACVAKLAGKSWFPSWKRVVFISTFCHLIATLAVHATRAIVESDIANLLVSCQPIFTFLLTTNFTSRFDFSTLLSLLMVVIGAFMFQINSTSLMFNSWGLVAAAMASIAFSKRNVTLKEEGSSTLEHFVAVSFWSATFVLPLWLLKTSVTQSASMGRVVSDIIFAAYSLISVLLLSMVTPVTHAFVVICVRLVSTIETILTFGASSISANALFSLLVIAVGVSLYILNGQQTTARYVLKLVLLPAIVVFSVLLNPNYPLWSSDEPSHTVGGGFPQMLLLRDRSITNGISTAWLYDRDIPGNVVMNIGYIADSNPSKKVYVYCGINQCIHEVASLEKENIVVGFAVISDIVNGTPLEKWAADHPKNKLLAGRDFERHVHQVATLGILWEYGGCFVNPEVKLINRHLDITGAVFSLNGADFPRHHPIIEKAAGIFARTYPNRTGETFNSNAIWKPLQTGNMHVFNDSFLTIDSLKDGDTDSKTCHYGILSRISSLSPINYHLNEEVENFAALQFLPFADCNVDRSSLESACSHDDITVFFNGKWMSDSEGKSVNRKFDHLNFVMLSVSLESRMRQNWSEHLSYIKTHEPVGCRDMDTLDYLHSKGVKGFLGSLILLMKNSNLLPHQERHRILLVQVMKENMLLLPKNIRGLAEEANSTVVSPESAYELLKLMGSAKLVVTENVQYALSCVALDTPVIYVNAKNEHIPDVISSLFHVVNMNDLTWDKATEWFQKFSWNKISHNPNPAVFMRLRATSWKIVRQNQHLHDAARRFGVVPMSLPLSLQAKFDSQPNLVFRLVFSTSKKSSLSLTGSLTKVSGQFNWRHWRSIESIFYHHPTAEVKVYSNTLPGDTFDILTEAGYSIEVCRYRLEDLLKGTIAEGFIKKLKKVKKGYFWYSHQTDLLRLFLLYRLGGIYMDTDIILVKPVDTLKMNTVGWEDSSSQRLNGAFAKFEKGNFFLETCLKEFVRSYRGDIWAYNCPALLTRVYKAFDWSDDVINIVDYKKFYMISGNDMKQQCFTDTKGKRFNKNMRILKEEAYVVHTNGKISGTMGINGMKLKNGTICKQLLNSYCVLCDKIH